MGGGEDGTNPNQEEDGRIGGGEEGRMGGGEDGRRGRWEDACRPSGAPIARSISFISPICVCRRLTGGVVAKWRGSPWVPHGSKGM